jgi:GDP-L-fucose synthase
MKVYVAGHRGLVGSAISRALDAKPEHTWIGASSKELDLRDRAKVFDFVLANKPDAVIIAAAKVGGIGANQAEPVEFLRDNLLIQTNLMDACHNAGIEKLLFLGSSCIYPKMAPQPILEEYLLTGPLEETNAPYAIAKIAGITLVQAYRREYGHSWISAMPTNLYGPGDNFQGQTSHVLPALIKKIHEAHLANLATVTLWGDGTPLREFLHVDDLASACLKLLESYDSDIPLNIGAGEEISIFNLATLVSDVIQFQGTITWDATMPNGTPRKLLDSTKIRSLGWAPSIPLAEGVASTYDWFLESLREL